MRDDGEVIVVGEYLTEDALSAAVRFVSNEGEPLTDEAAAPTTYKSALSLH